MLAKACACAVVGLEGALIEVEVDIGQGLPAFSIVGLPDAAVNEAKERVADRASSCSRRGQQGVLIILDYSARGASSSSARSSSVSASRRTL